MSETGHAKNVANFQQVINILVALGADYNPVQALILLSALQARLAVLQPAMAQVDAKAAAEKIAVDERIAEFEGIGAFATNIKNAVVATIDDDLFTEDVKSIVRKLNGRRSGDAPVDDPATPGVDESDAAHSVSQQSYDNLEAHFASLIELLRTRSDYTLNETEYRLGSLEEKLDRMRAKNNAAKVASINSANARQTRDEILYDEETGILKLVKLIKAYLAYAVGKNSAAYQQIEALEFRKVK